MAKVSSEAKERYFEKVKKYKAVIEKLLAREKNILGTLDADDPGIGYKRLTLAENVLDLASYYVLLHEISLALLGVKNEAFLNDARKAVYKAVIYLEEVVSNFIDVPFSEYEEKLALIEDFTIENKLALISKMGYSIQSIMDGFGPNSKWKWSFVELEGRFATIVKNFINLKEIISKMDPRVDGYQFHVRHLNLSKEYMQYSADRYREKYELSTLRIDDFKVAIQYLGALKRLLMLTGDVAASEVVKRKIDVWKSKMDDDDKKKK